MACTATSQFLQLYTTTRVTTTSHVRQQQQPSPSLISRPFLITTTTNGGFHGHHKLLPVARFSLANDGTVTANDDDGVSLGTVKLPSNTDLQRFETLLFQWANSLCQGASIPLPIPLKVDKIPGGARLAFITIGDGTTEVLVYIDCLVFPATGDSGPIFRAIRNGPLKDQSLPGESRVMRSLLQALQKSVEIART